MLSKQTYVSRRNLLRSKLSGGLVIMVGNQESPKNYMSNCYHFRQDSNFLYYFGIAKDGFAAVMDIESGEDILFADDLTMDDIVWTGILPSVSELADSVGVSKSYPLKQLKSVVDQAISKGRKIHFLPTYRWSTVMMLHDIVGIRTLRIKDYVSEELIRAVISQREIKSSEEMVEIDKAVDITCQMQITAMKMCRPGETERNIAGTIEGIANRFGAGVSFNPIVSINGNILHNPDYNNTLSEGKLLLVDCGAESLEFYAGDQTRTFPVSGHFTQRQKDVYEIVLNAKVKAEKVAAPGLLYRDVHLNAMKDITDGLKSLGLMQGDTDEAVAAGAPALFMPHGLGHQMGLDVHDMEGLGENYVGYDSSVCRSEQFGTSALRMAKKLCPGHVLTVEPGIYFMPELFQIWKKEQKCSQFINYDKTEEFMDFGGIRLENDILITETGNRQTGTLYTPITVNEIEEMTGKYE